MSEKKKYENAKFDGGKNRLDLVFPSIIEELGFIRTYGSNKYHDETGTNWERIENPKQRYTAALLRHINAWRMGEKIDPESGFRHLSHAACNIMFLIELERREDKNSRSKSKPIQKVEEPKREETETTGEIIPTDNLSTINYKEENNEL